MCVEWVFVRAVDPTFFVDGLGWKVMVPCGSGFKGTHYGKSEKAIGIWMFSDKPGFHILRTRASARRWRTLLRREFPVTPLRVVRVQYAMHYATGNQRQEWVDLCLGMRILGTDSGPCMKAEDPSLTDLPTRPPR